MLIFSIIMLVIISALAGFIVGIDVALKLLETEDEKEIEKNLKNPCQ